MIYNALIGSRLTYGLHALPLKEDLLPTHIDRTSSNKYVLERARVNVNETEEERTNKKESEIILMSELIIKMSMKELGEVIRLLNEDPRRQVTLVDHGICPKHPECSRVGCPRTNWATKTVERVWNSLQIHDRKTETTCQQFNVNNFSHLSMILEAAGLNEF